MTFSNIGITHLRFHQWATQRVLDEVLELPAEELVKDMKNSFPSLYDTLAHIYQSDAVWFDRLRGLPIRTREEYAAPGCTWELKDAWKALHDQMIEWAGKLEETDWVKDVAYKNFAGQSYADPIWQIILHVVNHGTYHRGQVTTMLRQLDHKPVNLDLIAYYRAQ